MKICIHCSNTFETNNKYIIECPFCLERRKKTKVGEYLRMLDDIGWSELIDARWKGNVKKDILKYDPSASEKDIDETLKLVIW